MDGHLSHPAPTTNAVDAVRADMPPNTSSEWLKASEAAQYLKVKTRTLLLWARQRKVKGYKLSGIKRHVWRFRQVDLDASLELPSVLPEERMTE